MKKIVKFGLIPLVLIIVGIVIYNYPRLNIITGFSAKSVCSCTFEAGRDLASIEAGDNDIETVDLAKNSINFEEKNTSVRFSKRQSREPPLNINIFWQKFQEWFRTG